MFIGIPWIYFVSCVVADLRTWHAVGQSQAQCQSCNAVLVYVPRDRVRQYPGYYNVECRASEGCSERDIRNFYLLNLRKGSLQPDVHGNRERDYFTTAVNRHDRYVFIFPSIYVLGHRACVAID